MKRRQTRVLWLINRGARPSYHRAPFHPVIICDLKKIYEWERGDTGDQCCCWVKENCEAMGWLWLRWMGLDIDYGPVVHGEPLPDGRQVAFVHNGDEEPWTLLKGAVWWSDTRIPKWIEKHGVVYPPDAFSQLCILDNIA